MRRVWKNPRSIDESKDESLDSRDLRVSRDPQIYRFWIEKVLYQEMPSSTSTFVARNMSWREDSKRRREKRKPAAPESDSDESMLEKKKKKTTKTEALLTMPVQSQASH